MRKFINSRFVPLLPSTRANQFFQINPDLPVVFSSSKKFSSDEIRDLRNVATKTIAAGVPVQWR
jgi:hypothetical protein